MTRAPRAALPSRPVSTYEPHLVVMDVDSTFITGEVVELLAAHAGSEVLVTEITERAMRGEIDFAASLHERVATLAGLPESRARRRARRGGAVAGRPGAGRRAGSPRLAGRARLGRVHRDRPPRWPRRFGITLTRANALEVVDGLSPGKVSGPVIDRAAKAAVLREYAEVGRDPDGAHDRHRRRRQRHRHDRARPGSGSRSTPSRCCARPPTPSCATGSTPSSTCRSSCRDRVRARPRAGADALRRGPPGPGRARARPTPPRSSGPARTCWVSTTRRRPTTTGARGCRCCCPPTTTRHAADLHEELRHRLPPELRGWTTRVAPRGVRRHPRARRRHRTGPVDHRVEILTLDALLLRLLGPVDPRGPMTAADWLVVPQQRLLSLTAGAVFHDDLGLEAVRERLRYYPHDVWLYQQAAAWTAIGQDEHLAPRAGIGRRRPRLPPVTARVCRTGRAARVPAGAPLRALRQVARDGPGPARVDRPARSALAATLAAPEWAERQRAARGRARGARPAAQRPRA